MAGQVSRAGLPGGARSAGPFSSVLRAPHKERFPYRSRGNEGGGKGFLVIEPKKPFAEFRSSSGSRLGWERLLAVLSPS